MPVDIGPKIGIEGERQFRQELQQINQSIKTLASEAKSVEAAMRDETDAEKKNAAQKDVLNRQILTQKDKLELLEKGLRESANKYGEADVKTQKWQQAVYDAQAELSRMENKLQGTDEELDDYKEGMEDAGNATKGWADVMKGSLLADAVKSGLSKIVDLAKGAASAMLDASKAGAAYADDIMSMSDTTGLSATALQEYKYMADLIDVSLDTVTGSMSKLTKTMSSAQKGSGEAADAFRALGVDVVDSNGALRKAEDVFGDVLTALGKIDNETERDATAMKIFGKSAQELNPLIKAGSKEINKLAKEAHDAGYVLSGSALKALNKQQDAMDRLGKKTEALKNRFAVGLAPGITKAADAMGEAFDNPRFQRGISALASGIGDLVDGAANLAADILPDVFRILDFGDARLRVYTDTELELANSIDDMAEAHRLLADEYTHNAGVIVGESKRTEDLWKELQTLVTEEGNVKKGNEERVDFILHELNDALGTEYTRNGNIITQYGQMKQEISDLIKLRQAEALLAAKSDSYAQGKENQQTAAEKAAAAARSLEEARAALARAHEAEATYLETHANLGVKTLEDARDLFGVNTPAYLEVDALIRQLDNAEDKVQSFEQDLATARSTYYKTVEDVATYEQAQSAFLQGRYDEAISLLTKEFDATVDFYLKKGKLTEDDKKAFAEKIKEQEGLIEEYKLALRQGVNGFTEEGLRKMELFVAQAKYLLDGKLIGEMFVGGLVTGIQNKQSDAFKAAWSLASSVEKAIRQRLEIQSPSRVGIWLGEMWDAGLVNGLEAREDEIARSASNLADTIVTSSTPSGALDIAYGNGLTAAGYGSSSTAYTTNMGGIAVYVNGAGAVNEDELAKRIAVQLTDELTRAQRGGRL